MPYPLKSVRILCVTAALIVLAGCQQQYRYSSPSYRSYPTYAPRSSNTSNTVAEHIKVSTDLIVCLNSIRGSEPKWETSAPIWRMYVAEAKRRGFTEQHCARVAGPGRKPKPPIVARVIPDNPSPTPSRRSRPSRSSTGSGFFVSKLGHIVTNAHVVDRCRRITVGANANNQTTAILNSKDDKNDLALLKLASLETASAETKSLIKNLGLKVVPLAAHGLLRSEDVELGESVLVAGFPFGDLYSDTHSTRLFSKHQLYQRFPRIVWFE
jgi:S1-C subfamily serine protease